MNTKQHMTKFRDQLRDYQEAAKKKAISYFKTHQVFRFNMCVGGGKTTTAIHTAMTMVGNNGKIVVVCHTENLRNQFEENVAQQLMQTPQQISQQWSFYTFQGLIKKTKVEVGTIDLLIIDEVHQGGQADDGSYNSIMNRLKPKKVLLLSATDAGVSEEVFGKKTKTNSYTFSFADAKKAGVLNDCDIITIHTGLDQDIKHLDLETVSKVKGKDIHDIQEKAKRKKVDLAAQSSKDALTVGMIHAAIEVYFQVECSGKKLPKAIFFVEDKAQADKCLAMFKARFSVYTHTNNIFGMDIDQARVTYSGMEKNNNIEDFRNGVFPVLINVRQVQEGFDDRTLELVFDCSPSFSNEGRVFIQRIGRELRINEGKKISRYYTFYKPSGRMKNFDTKEAAETLFQSLAEANVGMDKSEAAQAALESAVAVAIEAELAGHACGDTDTKVLNMIEKNQDLYIDLNGIEAPKAIYPEISINGEIAKTMEKQKVKPIYYTKGEFIVTKARGKTEKNRVRLHNLLKQTEDYSMAEFIASAKKLRGLV